MKLVTIGTVLVHCLDGVSLSSTIIVVYLLIRTTLDINTAIKVVRAVRPFANPNHGFRRQMEDWSREERKFWKHRMEMWPDVKYGDKRRCNHLVLYVTCTANYQQGQSFQDWCLLHIWKLKAP
ncbi:hypothetical protein EB796_006023 [Bugula neritina]|uniref:Tyrosine specific protein phosphatases domain-containing protein n=1 Tax=Bugula neritina TaxID=10212 RepID=A0A7J7KBL2_BUGNE|nr:hypothetical protein EB796_006023 [Bugula neritina]